MTKVKEQPAQNVTEAPASPEQKQVNTVPAIAQPTHSERFTNAIEREFSSNAGELNLTSYQRKLCQNYFIKIDSKLKELEVKRMKTPEQYRDPLAFTWENINLPKQQYIHSSCC